jgi:hypothetical protein
MMKKKRNLSHSDILPLDEYAKIRTETRVKLSSRKRDRRIEVGPYVTFFFESYETMWLQVQEMLFIEKGGSEQIEGELAAYNPLIPKGEELVATFMIEIDDPERRRRVLSTLGGIEDAAFIEIGGKRITGMPETDQDRTTAEGKASSVQFVHFPFTPAQIAMFRAPGAKASVGFAHPAYGHMAIMPEATRLELAGDFD